MSRRKGTPCACECDPCGSKKCIKAINNVSGDPNGDFEILAGVGIEISQSSDNSITIVNQADPNAFIAGDNIEINPSGDSLEIRVTDDVSIHNLNVAGDIIQQGAAYETYAEKIYTTNDYIYMREGAVGGLASGSYAGFEVIKYDGTNDGRLVIDNSGVARVGDVGDEQPLLTREESANLNNGALLKWDAANLKAVDEGTVGSDTKPIKIVNGVATEITDALQKNVGIKWIEIAYYTLPANTLAAHSNVSVDFPLSNTITDTSKVGFIAMDYLGPGPYQTYAHYLYNVPNNTKVTVQIWNEGDGPQNGQWVIRFVFFELA